MATDIDPLESVNTLLSNNWNDVNTDSITPTFDKIYNQPKDLDLRNNDYILTYSIATNMGFSGIGSAAVANVDEAVMIDIRVGITGTETVSSPGDAHARKVKAEVQRILFSNRANPDSNFSELNPYNQWIDKSDKMRRIYRYLIQVNLVSNCRDMTA